MKLKLTLVSLSLLLPLVSIGQTLKLKNTDVAPQNYIKLDWYWDPSAPAGTYGFTLYQWDNSLSTWQTTSTNYDKTIKVLNVYPDVGNNLEQWMEVDEIEVVENGVTKRVKVGRGKIDVTPMTITNFNANPNGELKDGLGNYKYDVIMFGSWDSNNGKDLNATSAAAVRAFLDSGRGVLFGHDTQFTNHPHFVSLADKTNLNIHPTDARGTIWRGSTKVKAINNGFLLKYPWDIQHNSVLTTPYSHSTGQRAQGVVWMNYPWCEGNGSTWTAAADWVNNGTNDFYLTTWNNASMIQTGHSGGAATDQEKMIIANTLWYLAQFTTETNASVYSARDVASPTIQSAVRNSNDCSKVSITSYDNGTSYRFKVKATKTTDYNVTYETNPPLDVVNKTGLKGYIVEEHTSPSHVITVSRDSEGKITTPLTISDATDNVAKIYNVNDMQKYIHIVAIDHADNVSTQKTLNAIPTISYSGGPFCATGTKAVTLSLPAVVGTYSASPAGLSINSTNGTIDLGASTPGTYTVTYNCTTDGCPKPTTTVTVNALPVVSFEQVVVEGNEGSTLSFKVKLTGGHCSSANATVTYTTVNGTAVAPGDYTAVSGTLTFTPGETEKTIPITTIGNDNLIEGDEEFTFKLSSPTNCKFASGTELSATGRIKDQTDGSIIVEKFLPAVGDAAEPSTDGAFRIRYKTNTSITNPNKDVKLSFKVTGGTVDQDYNITAGADVSLNADKVSGIAIIRKNQNGVVVPIKVRDNYIVQGTRTLELEITGIVP